MAKVSLRIYNREIESLVDSGQLDEAIAHCRHILNTFPKHLETYRMIGKAYLEAKRYDEATDIFERLLMAVPDDFVAHVGMSIIRDEQKEMDAAIWHMQRAFEVQPSNSAIQAELQRLYGRRDGIEPPKIRLTRGALAHMYVQGELYPQAIAEIDNVLEEDPDRQDMQVLLARAYFHAGQKNEAADMCSQLLRRYPYCFDANRVLVELLPQTEQADSVQTYRKRVNELDPYITFVTGSVFHADEVPDAAVSLERLEWDGQLVDMGPEWGESKGIGLGETSAADDEEPDWLKSAMASESPGGSSEHEPASASQGLPIPTPSAEEDDIPEFLREAGWGKDTGTFKEGQISFDDSDDSSEGLSLAEGDLPDWVKAMDPTSGEGEAVSPQAELSDDNLAQDDVPDWLQDLGEEQSESSEEQPLAEGELPDWLEPAKPAEEPASEQVLQEQPMAEPTSDEDIPDWLKAVQPEEDGDAPQEPIQESPQEPAQEAQDLNEETLSDWQVSDEVTEKVTEEGSSDLDEIDTGTLGTTAAEQDDAIAWLESLASKHGAKPEELVTDPNARSETEPDWVQKAKATTEQTDTEEPALQEQTPAETPVDLPEFLAQKQSASVEEPAPDADIPVAEEQPLTESPMDLPGFLAEKSAESTEEPAAEADTSNIADLGTSAQEQDDAVAWLESLASKHGAKPEELVTDPEARKETAPEWVQKASEASSENALGKRPTAPPSDELEELAESALGEQEGEIPSAEVEEVQKEEPISSTDTDETGMWLQELAEEENLTEDQVPTVEVETPAMEDDDIPEWLREMEGDAPQMEAASTSGDEAPLPDWLSGMDSDEAESDESTVLPSETETSLPESELGQDVTEVDAAAQEDDSGITDWLKNVEAESSEPESEPEVPSAEADEQAAADLPSWLSGLDEGTEQPQPVTGNDDDLPEWLRGEVEEEPAQPQPTTPTDWQPVDDPLTQEELPAPEPESKVDEPAPAVEPEVQEESAPVIEAEVEAEEPAPAPIEEAPVQAAPPPDAEPESKPEPETLPETPVYQEPVTRSRTGMTGILSDVEDPAFTDAQNELTRGDVTGAMKSYSKLIKKGKMLDEIIFDLREALYRYPVDVNILQTLGDAYMRADRLQEALDSYTKAEELLR